MRISCFADNPVKYTDPDGREDDDPYIRAEANGNNVKYFKQDGSGVERSGGTRSWRNNNPGNIRGAPNEIGNAGGFAVFSDYDTGFEAITILLGTDRYNSLSINDAITKYAPPSENDTKNYQNLLVQLTGLDNSRLISSLSDEELNSVATAIQRIEGYRVGTETPISIPNPTL
jgi:hypothetical protein